MVLQQILLAIKNRYCLFIRSNVGYTHKTTNLYFPTPTMGFVKDKILHKYNGLGQTKIRPKQLPLITNRNFPTLSTFSTRKGYYFTIT